MACTIDSTVGGETANSYADIDDANEYHDTHPYASAWEAATDDMKCRALVTATRLLDTWFEWSGDIVTASTQSLLWPRIGAYGPNGFLVASDEIPVLIVDATAELARQLLISDRTADSGQEATSLRSVSVGSISLSFADAVAKPIPDAVLNMASFFGTQRLASGTGAIHMYRA